MALSDDTAVRPRLDERIEQRRAPDGRLVLVGATADAYMDVRPREEPVLALVDGTRDLDALVAAGLELIPPVRPLETLELLRRLSRQDLLRGLGPAEEHLFGHGHGGPFRMVARLADFRLHLGLLRWVVEPGRLLPRAALPLLHLVALAGVASALGYALWLGRVRLLVDPFVGFSQPFRELVAIYLGIAATLSVRGLYRGLLLRALGLSVPRAGIRVLAGIAHFDVDDRERRAARREDRHRVAVGGLAAICLCAGAAAWGYILNAHWMLRFAAPAAMVTLVVNLAPYLHTDLAEVIAIRFRVPQLRHRSLSWLLRRSARNLLRRVPLSPRERRYLAVAFLWLLHGVVSVHILAAWLVPGALAVASDIIAGRGAAVGSPSGVLIAVGLALAAILALGLAALVLGLVIAAMAVLVQLARPQRDRPPLLDEPADEPARAAFVDQAGRIPFLARIGAVGLAELAGTMRREVFDARGVVVRQGEPGDRLYFVEGGRCGVDVEETSGRRLRVAELGPGDFFGELALLHEQPRAATVVALERVEALSLQRDAFLALLDELEPAARAAVAAQIRDAGFLRLVPAFAHLPSASVCRLLRDLTAVEVAAGEAVVTEGDAADAMYVVREGELAVDVAAPPGSSEAARRLATLRPTDVFGEMALLLDRPRLATVRALTPAVVLRIPVETFREVLLQNFAAAVTLDHGCAARLDALQRA